MTDVPPIRIVSTTATATKIATATSSVNVIILFTSIFNICHNTHCF
nr:MAG TPA: hypothetical protein [Caudoviricetes sp.]